MAQVLERGQQFFGDELAAVQGVEGVLNGGAGEGPKPALRHETEVVGRGGLVHIADGKNDEFVAFEVVLGEHPAMEFEYVGLLHTSVVWWGYGFSVRG